MIIVEKNPGQKIDYEVNKTKITFDDDLTLNLAKREEDYAVHIDVCFDEDGALCIGAAAGRSYVAQIDIPPRQYKEVPATSAETTTGEAADDADGRDSVTTKRVKHRDTYEVSEPGVGSGSDRGKLVPKSGMEDGEKSCVYFCGARTANRHR